MERVCGLNEKKFTFVTSNYLERAIDEIGKFLTESLVLLECRRRLIHYLTKE